ncbi:uncharacterized protein LOC135843934 [Planococcus citri]|uniref:uncharacterized protein LOC135843934 n=1 Tax=Planococcus citri TaxID=170843 RepID=UPI0031F73B58
MKKLLLLIPLITIQPMASSAFSLDVDTVDFKDLVLNNDVFVDKTLLIHQFSTLFNTSLILRPTGWGKSINMDMIRRFFKIETDNLGNPLPKNQTENYKLFFGGVLNTGLNQTKTLNPLKIANVSNSLHHVGKYPVILLKFKNISGDTFEEVVENIESSIMDTYKAHRYLLNSPLVTKSDQLERYLKGELDDKSLRNSISFLSEKLHEHFDENVIILIDDYETPVMNAFALQSKVKPLSRPFHFHVESLLKEIYNDAFRPFRNPWVKFGLLAGEHLIPVDDRDCLLSRVSVLRQYYETELTQFYGFTQVEVQELLQKTSHLPINVIEAKNWYNGYKYKGYGNYNSRSIMQYLAHNATLASYASKVHKNDTIGYIDRILTSDTMQKRIQTLISEECDYTYRTTRRYINMEYKSELCNREDQTRMLINKGYLALDRETPNDVIWCLYIPNEEMKRIFHEKTSQWVFAKFDITDSGFRSFVNLLTSGDVEKFANSLQMYHDKATNYLQNAKDNLFVLYNGLITALQIILSETYLIIRSTDDQQEWFNGQGHDMHMIPKLNSSNLAIFLKCKIVQNEYLESSVDEGLKQINVRLYESEWKNQYSGEIKNMVKLSIAVSSEQVATKHDTRYA